MSRRGRIQSHRGFIGLRKVPPSINTWLHRPDRALVDATGYFSRCQFTLTVSTNILHWHLLLLSFPLAAVKRQLRRPLELLAPGPRLSQATEATLGRYCDSAVDSRGDRRVVRTERLPPEEFCFDAAQVRRKNKAPVTRARVCERGGREGDVGTER